MFELMFAAAAAVPQPCPIGTALKMTKIDQPPADLRSLPDTFRFLSTRHIRPTAGACTLRVERFDPNRSAVRFDLGRYVWFRDYGQPAKIVVAVPAQPGVENYDSEISWSLAKRCDSGALDSTTYGPVNSCAALYKSRSGTILRITRRLRGGEQAFSVKLPYRYTSITAGGWAHAVGGELALARQGDSGAVAIDIFTLLGT